MRKQSAARMVCIEADKILAPFVEAIEILSEASRNARVEVVDRWRRHHGVRQATPSDRSDAR